MIPAGKVLSARRVADIEAELLLAQFLALIERLQLDDQTVASVAGVSTHTVRVSRIGRVLPKQARCQAAFAEFVKRNGNARSREELCFNP